MVLLLRHALGIMLLDISVALVPEYNKFLRLGYFTLPLLVNIFTFISKTRVPYNTGVYWVVFC